MKVKVSASERESGPMMDLDVSRPNQEGDRQKRRAETCVIENRLHECGRWEQE